MPKDEVEISAIVMLSGGLDSTVAAFWSIKKMKFKIETLTFDYFRRSRKEIEAAEEVSKIIGAENHRINLDFLKEIDDNRKSNKNPLLKSAPTAYIPCRNLIFYGIAASFAELLGCRYVIGGHNRDDTRFFPDSSPRFFEVFNRATSIGMISASKTGRVVLPLGKLSKAQVVRLGSELGVPFDLTWSCYFQYKRPCGKCPACRLRKAAFKEAGIRDSLLK